MRRSSLAVALAVVSALAAQSERGTPRVLQGPMVGAIAPDAATLWVRVSGEVPVEIEFAPEPTLVDARCSGSYLARRDDDFAVKVKLVGLLPGTRYYYRVLVDGALDRYQRGLAVPSFTTAPAVGAPAAFTVACGSCARFGEDPEQPIWRHVRAAAPALFLWLGDNIYGDTLEASVLREEYRRQRDVAALQPLLRSVPQLAIWDDHDYGLDNHDRTSPVREAALDAFHEYWANPSGGLPDDPGVYFAASYGGVDFFCLDVRYHRDPVGLPDGPTKSMLGARQRDWLYEALRASQAPFKVLVSGSGWSNARGPKGDSWSAYLHERDALFDFIRDQGVAGVLLLSGDTHYGELNVIPRSQAGGYDLFELVCSPLAQRPTGGGGKLPRPEQRVRRAFVEATNFGLLEFDLRQAPKVRLQLIAGDGRPAWSLVELAANDLRNGVSVWRDKTDPVLLPASDR
jgi:alkaline phosphatase D